LTVQAGAPLAAGDPAAYTNAGYVQHIVYRDKDGHINELFTGGGPWARNNLTQAAGAPKATGNPYGYLAGHGDTLSGTMRNRLAREHHGKAVVYFRYGGGGWSNGADDFVVMPSVWNPNDLNFLAHELGHYFHLDHTFYPGGISDGASAIQKYVEDIAKAQNNGQLPKEIPQEVIDRGLEALDGDRSTVSDTPAELQWGMFKNNCDPNESAAKVPVTFGTEQAHDYPLQPDRDNVMNYIEKNCRGTPAHFSNQQLARMRNAIESGNRNHLIGQSLSIDPTSLTFSASVGGANPPVKTLKITDSSGGTLSWTAEGFAKWLKISPKSGASPSTVTLSVDIAGLALGTHVGSLTISAPDAKNSSVGVQVFLAVKSPPPKIAVKPKSLSFTASAGGANPAPKFLIIDNAGTGVVTWMASVNSPWLSISPASGSAGPAPSKPTVSVNISGLAPGTYHGTITLNQVIVVAATLTISPGLPTP
jgi:hypothetical protein